LFFKKGVFSCIYVIFENKVEFFVQRSQNANFAVPAGNHLLRPQKHLKCPSARPTLLRGRAYVKLHRALFKKVFAKLTKGPASIGQPLG